MIKRKIPISFYETLEEYKSQLFLNDQEMPPMSSPVYSEIGKLCNISDKTVYLRVKRLKEKNKLMKPAENHSENIEEAEDDIRTYDSEDLDDEDTTTITLKNNHMEDLVPSIKIYKGVSKDRRVTTLLPGWADVLCDVMWEELKIPCCLSFKKVNVTADGLNTVGVCTECSFKCRVQSSPDFSKLEITMQAGIANVVHVKKRKVTGKRRLMLGNEISDTKSQVFRNKMANKLMEDYDVEPATLPNTGKSFLCSLILKLFLELIPVLKSLIRSL